MATCKLFLNVIGFSSEMLPPDATTLKKDLRAFTLVGPTRQDPVLPPSCTIPRQLTMYNSSIKMN